MKHDAHITMDHANFRFYADPQKGFQLDFKRPGRLDSECKATVWLLWKNCFLIPFDSPRDYYFKIAITIIIVQLILL